MGSRVRAALDAPPPPGTICRCCRRRVPLSGTDLVVAARPISFTVEMPAAAAFAHEFIGQIPVSTSVPALLRLPPRVFATTMEGRRAGLFAANAEIIVGHCVIFGPADLRRFARPRRSAADLHFVARPRELIVVRVSGRGGKDDPGRLMLQFVFEGHLAPLPQRFDAVDGDATTY